MSGFPKGAKRTADKAKRPHIGIHHDPEVIGQLIVKHNGNVSRVADAIGTDRGTINRIIKREPHLQEILSQARERLIDEVEASVFERAADSNDTQLQQFVLKTQARNRGWEPAAVTDKADIAVAALQFIMNQSKNPAEPSAPVTITSQS